MLAHVLQCLFGATLDLQYLIVSMTAQLKLGCSSTNKNVESVAGDLYSPETLEHVSEALEGSKEGLVLVDLSLMAELGFNQVCSQ